MLASIAFTVQASRRHDQLVRWLGPAFALGAFARVNYVLFPSLYSGWLYTGDLLRTGCYVLLLVGAAREIGHYWAGPGPHRRREDRRRLARELHDGVVQELGYIRGRVGGIDPAAGAERGRRLRPGAGRGPGAIDALGQACDEPLRSCSSGPPRQVAERYGGQVAVELDESVNADAEQRHALVRITREAVSNAIRHGAAGWIRTWPGTPTARRLVVRTTARVRRRTVAGRGQRLRHGQHARPRAGLPGALTISSVPGRARRIEVTW